MTMELDPETLTSSYLTAAKKAGATVVVICGFVRDGQLVMQTVCNTESKLALGALSVLSKMSPRTIETCAQMLYTNRASYPVCRAVHPVDCDVAWTELDPADQQQYRDVAKDILDAALNETRSTLSLGIA